MLKKLCSDASFLTDWLNIVYNCFFKNLGIQGLVLHRFQFAVVFCYQTLVTSIWKEPSTELLQVCIVGQGSLCTISVLSTEACGNVFYSHHSPVPWSQSFLCLVLLFDYYHFKSHSRPERCCRFLPKNFLFVVGREFWELHRFYFFSAFRTVCGQNIGSI